MANDKKNINELVTGDDDPTAELEALVLPSTDADELESAASTAGFQNRIQRASSGDAAIADLQSDLKARSETINRLQYDMAQLHSRWLGLETEIKEREKISRQLNADLADSLASLKRKNELLKARDQKIKALKLEIRERNTAHKALQDNFDALNKHLSVSSSDDTQQQLQLLAKQAGQLASDEITIRELNERYSRLERYADELRQQIQDRDAATGSSQQTVEFLQERLEAADRFVATLQHKLAGAEAETESLNKQLAALHSAHADEIRMIRFELGAAQETVSQQELIAEQLASDLVETRTYRIELESMLTEAEKSSNSRIEALEKENRRLRRETRDQQQKLDTKSEAINCLLSELAKKTQQIESIGEIENVIHEIDDRMSERIDEHAPVEKDRVTRVLVGTIDDQELRFPLFKDRLTIGRTEQNDIQLKASYISRRHAVVVTEGRATRVIDWGSKNGVFVNSKRVTEHFLKNGDVLTVGTADFRYEERPKRDT